jgi:hypothetical protein
MFKKPSLVAATALLLVAAALASGRLWAAPPSSAATRSSAPVTLPRAAAAGQMTLFGHIRSLTRKGKRFELRFDPAWWLTGVTAQRAAVEDGVIRPGEAVPNDYYIVDETHRLLTYIVPTGAHVTILTAGTNTRAVTVAGLAHRVRTGATRGRGFWILVGNTYPSAVRSLDQQYQP